MAFLSARALYLNPGRPAADRAPAPGPVTIVWLAGMAAMLAILLIGHATNDLDAGQTLKSAMGWAKGWALLAVFPLAGAVLQIRPEIVYRAICKLGLQTLLLLPLFLIAPVIGLPGQLYVSPLQIFGGSGPEFFAVVLYTHDPVTHVARWQFFAPWSPAAGMVAIVYMLCAIEDRSVAWRATGIAAALALAIFSQSRLALVAIAIVWPLAYLLSWRERPILWFAGAAAALCSGWFAPQIAQLIDQASADFTGARADSSRVRATLGRIALDRWQHEAPWFGHGIVERGPHIVEYMPIGSHHSWYGLLFVKGLTGALALAGPLLFSLIYIGGAAARAPVARVAFSMLFTILLYTFGENLEVLGYLIWPGLILIGCADHAISAPWRLRVPAA